MRRKSVSKRVGLLLALVLFVGLVSGCAAQKTGEAETYDIIYSSSNPVPEIAVNVRPSVVQVITSAETWDPQTRKVATEIIGYGSGTYFRALDDKRGGYILTNNHVIADGEVYEIEWLDGTVIECSLVGADDGTDIAVLKFTESAPEGAAPVPLGDSDALQIGELAVIIGNPGTSDSVLFGTVTAGIVSGLEREEISAGNFSRSVSVIQVDAAINSGNSGGALLNASGELVGIPTLKLMYDYSTVFEGLGFCVPINAAKDVIEQLIDTGTVVRPRIGVTVADIDGPEDPIRNYPPAGIQVQSVEKDSPAEVAGLKVYDIITQVNGERVYTYTALTGAIDKMEIGEFLELTVCRFYDETGLKLDEYEILTFQVELKILD